MRALLTGGTGFVGTRLAKCLNQTGVEVWVLVRQEGARRPVPADCRTVPAELADFASVRAAFRQIQPEVVFHAAMPSGHPATAGERLDALNTAVTGTAHVAEAAAETGVRRLVHLGSFLSYRPQDEPLRESDPLEPVTARGAAKAAASLWLRQFARSQRFSAVELRIFTVYGPGEAPNRFIPTVLQAARTGAGVSLHPTARRDLVYVDDVVAACACAAEATVEPGAVFNIGGGHSWSNEEVLQAAREASGRPIEVLRRDYPARGADGNWLADISAAAAGLGWRPRIGLHDGLREAYRCLN